MIVVGELLNSSQQKVEEAFINKDESFIIDLAVQQERAGCTYLNLNAATMMEKEEETLVWAISLLQAHVSIPISIDSPNPKALAAGLKVHRGRALLNSLPGKRAELEEIIPLIREFSPEVIVSCLDDEGFPETPEKALRIAERILNRLFSQTSIQKDDIFIDPLVRPLAVFPEAARLFLEAMLLIKKEFPGMKTIAGLSNISFGLPKRKIINHAFLSNLIGYGLTAVIADPLQPDFWPVIIISEFINNKPGATKRFLDWARTSRKED